MMAAGGAAACRVGPNAITRVAEALSARAGAATARRIFAEAGIGRHLDHPPAEMVDEDEVARLHAALRVGLDADAAEAVSRAAGRATGDYLLAHRIPRPAQAVLRLLPARLACRLLLRAIARHAWTFAGSGSFAAEAGNPAFVRITGCPLVRRVHAEAPACSYPACSYPACTYYAATFERIFRALVSPAATVEETECEARGDAACVFRIAW